MRSKKARPTVLKYPLACAIIYIDVSAEKSPYKGDGKSEACRGSLAFWQYIFIFTLKISYYK